MQFAKGNKLAKGGRRKGAGRSSRFKREVKEMAKAIAREYIEKHITDVLKAYKQLAAGRWVNHYHPMTGKYLYRTWEVDGATLRHWINKLLPDAAQEIRLDGKIAHTVIINTRDPDA